MLDLQKIAESSLVKIGNRYEVKTDYNEVYTGKLEFCRDGYMQFSTDDGGFRTARVGKCKLKKVEKDNV